MTARLELGLAVALVLGAAGCGQVAAPASPAIYEVAPTQAKVGDTVRLDGQGFGDVQADSQVSIHGAVATATSWSDGRVEVTVPGVPAGATVVVVQVGGRTSKPADLSILPSP